MRGDETTHSKGTRRLTREIKEKALSSGADLVGILKCSSINAVPRHWVGWQFQKYTKRTTDYMGDSKSVVVPGYHAWDDVHEIIISRGDRLEYPVYDRMRLFARRAVLRFVVDRLPRGGRDVRHQLRGYDQSGMRARSTHS